MEKYFLLLSLFFFAAFLNNISAQQAEPDRYTEQYRSQFHFSPTQNWMNDPNGLDIIMESIIFIISTILLAIPGVI